MALGCRGGYRLCRVCRVCRLCRLYKAAQTALGTSLVKVEHPDLLV